VTAVSPALGDITSAAATIHSAIFIVRLTFTTATTAAIEDRDRPRPPRVTDWHELAAVSFTIRRAVPALSGTCQKNRRCILTATTVPPTPPTLLPPPPVTTPPPGTAPRDAGCMAGWVDHLAGWVLTKRISPVGAGSALPASTGWLAGCAARLAGYHAIAALV